MPERLHQVLTIEQEGELLRNTKRGAQVRFSEKDGGVILVPQTIDCPEKTIVAVVFEVRQSIQDRVRVVWSEEAFLGEEDLSRDEIILDGEYYRGKRKKGDPEKILFKGVAKGIHESFLIDDRTEKRGVVKDGDEVAFLPCIQNTREAVGLRMAGQKTTYSVGGTS